MKIRVTFTYEPEEPDEGDATGMSAAEHLRLAGQLMQLGGSEMKIERNVEVVGGPQLQTYEDAEGRKFKVMAFNPQDPSGRDVVGILKDLDGKVREYSTSQSLFQKVWIAKSPRTPESEWHRPGRSRGDG